MVSFALRAEQSCAQYVFARVVLKQILYTQPLTTPPTFSLLYLLIFIASLFTQRRISSSLQLRSSSSIPLLYICPKPAFIMVYFMQSIFLATIVISASVTPAVAGRGQAFEVGKAIQTPELKEHSTKPGFNEHFLKPRARDPSPPRAKSGGNSPPRTLQGNIDIMAERARALDELEKKKRCSRPSGSILSKRSKQE